MIVQTYLPYYCRTRPTSCRPKPCLTDKPTIRAKLFCVTLTAYFMYVNLKLRTKGRNIVGCYMLCPFAHTVACWWELLRKV